jgi:hypothetical protein
MADDDAPAPEPIPAPELPRPITPDPGVVQTHGLDSPAETKIMIQPREGETRGKALPHHAYLPASRDLAHPVPPRPAQRPLRPAA